MGGTETPSYLVGIDDSQTGTNEFDFVTVKTSTHGPDQDLSWGDYVRVKPYKPDNGQWVATGFTMQGGTTNADVENLFVIFGRESTPPTITVTTDRTSYTTNDTIVVSGSVSTIIENNPITLTVTNPEGNLVEIVQIAVASDGSYSHTITAGGSLWIGDS